MDIVDYIPFGRENAVTRTQLRIMTGLNDRQIREQISQARRDTVILNMQDGKGYFRPLPEERKLVEAYARQETARLRSIGWSLKAARKMLKW
ncbi:hypothetical protein [uncultured Eubacterium sp.]|jgi:hypothetical protein|uniref:hypothetical protein n=1 Tax=uncultured Eubacterium sp. TaxID=165185 RepID=UPI00206634BF|nr:MAG TPA: hypothetical protein [Caudoviricetes sp.]